MTEWGVVGIIVTLIGLLATVLGLVHNYIVKPSNIKHEKSVEQIDKLIITMTELNASIKSMIETDKKHADILDKHANKLNELDRDFARMDLELGYIKKRTN